MSEVMQVKELVEMFEAWSPKSLAYDWDNVGLQVGSVEKTVNKVMITLDVLENVVDEAIEQKVDFIIAHHPLLFKSLNQINLDSPNGKIINKLIKHDISVYAAHTNLDITKGGVNDILADRLNLKDTDVLIPTGEQKLSKLVVYVPVDFSHKLTEAIGNAGAGHIGNYSHCMFKTGGEGSFKPQAGTNPFIGKQGELEKVNEVKVETIISVNQKATVLQAMLEAHPYEEPAFDLIPLDNEGERLGLGRIGTLSQTMSLRELCEYVKKSLDIPALRVVGDLDQQVSRIAVVGGSGKAFIEKAYKQGAEVYITGDMTFHDAQDAWQMGLNVIDPGHHVEKVMKIAVKNYLDKQVKHTGKKVEIVESTANTEPFQFL